MLLMREGFTEEVPRPVAAPLTVAAGDVGAIQVLRGQLLRISALAPGAVASLFGFSLWIRRYGSRFTTPASLATAICSAPACAWLTIAAVR